MSRSLALATALLAAAAALAGSAARAELFKCMKDGKVAYQDEPCPDTAVSKKLPSSYGDSSRSSAAGVDLVDVDAAARRLRGHPGSPTVLVLYSAKCPVCREVMPQMSALATQYRGRGVQWEVFSMDELEDLETVAPFLAAQGPAFAPVAIRPAPPGALGRAFAPLGINVGAQWAKPFVAVRDATGKVVMQGDGVADVSQMRGAIDAVAK